MVRASFGRGSRMRDRPGSRTGPIGSPIRCASADVAAHSHAIALPTAWIARSVQDPSASRPDGASGEGGGSGLRPDWSPVPALAST